MNIKYVAILFGASLAMGGCVIESTGSVGGNGGTGGTTGGTAGSPTGGTAGTAGTTGGTAGSPTGGTGGTAGGGTCGEVDKACTVDEDCCTGSCDGTVCLCNRCGEFITPDFGEQVALCPDDANAGTADTSDFFAIIDCMCAMGEGCEEACKDTCPVGDGTPSEDCILCAADFTKDVNGTCKGVQDTCANDL
jgi:hypothetical protein